MRQTALRTTLTMIAFALLLGVLGSPRAVNAQEESLESHKVIIQQIYDQVFNAGDMEVVDVLFAPNYIHYGYGDDATREGFTSVVMAMRAAMPDFTAQVEVLIAEDDWAASRVRFSGTFENPWVMAAQTIAPNGEFVQWSSNVLHRFNEDDQLVEDFSAFDLLSLLTKLGAVPLPPRIADLLTRRDYVPAVMGELISADMLEEHKDAFVHVIEDSLNQGDLTAIDTYMAEDYLTHEPFGDFSREQFREVVRVFRATVPDLVVTVDAMVAEGDWLAARLIYVGTFSNEIDTGLLIVPPTHRPIRFIINVFVRYNATGIGVEDFKEYNRLGWLGQAGLLPASL